MNYTHALAAWRSEAVASVAAALSPDRVGDTHDTPTTRKKLLGGVPLASVHTHILSHAVFWLGTAAAVVGVFALILAAFRWLQR